MAASATVSSSPFGQRQLQENTVHGPIGAQRAQQVHQLALADALR